MLAAMFIGLSLGFLGSFHCVGMCGPIALSLPLQQQAKHKRLLLIVLYNMGRAITYALLGGLFGMVGKQFFLTGYQQWFSIVVGLMILLALFLTRFMKGQSILAPWHIKVQGWLVYFLTGEKNSIRYLFIGMANGLLPCGFVYLAIASATATGTVWQGAALMFAFGLGTMPLMISIMVLGRAISFEARNFFRKASPYFIGLMACLLVLRGMNLGIPFISPLFEQAVNKVAVGCH